MYASSVYVMLLGWPAAMLAGSLLVGARRAALISIIGGNLFLPVAVLSFSGFPDYTKPVAAGLGALLAAFAGAMPQLFTWRPRTIDLFFLAFIFTPGISSILNGLGSYDALSAVLNRVLEWGVAYWVGRTLFDDAAGMKELAVAFVIGGMIYAPLCVWESVMSPRLHLQVYGFRPSAFRMARRWGGWRPMVFMQHGLAVGAWMASAAVVAWMLWRGRVVRTLLGVPIIMIAIGLVVVTVGLRSTGAAVLVVGLIGATEFVQFSRVRLAFLVLLMLPAGYIGLRVGGWDGEQLVVWTSRFSEDRANSLNIRLENDARIVDRALDKPMFGWGGWGRWRVRDEFGKDITVSDSWWGILVGTTGIVGLGAAYGCFMAPMFVMIRQRRRGVIFERADGAAWSVGLAILLFVIDTLTNAMPNSSFMLAAGAMSSFVLRRERHRYLMSLSPSQRSTSTSLSMSAERMPLPQRTIDLR